MNQLDGRFAARQIPGKREYQEDDFGLLDGSDLGIDGSEHSMLLVADGMGGHVGGATASGILSKTFVETYPRASGPIVDRLRECLEAANKAIADALADNPEPQRHGFDLGRCCCFKGRVELDQRGRLPVVDVPGGTTGAVECRPLHGSGSCRPCGNWTYDRRGSRPGFKPAFAAVGGHGG